MKFLSSLIPGILWNFNIYNKLFQLVLYALQLADREWDNLFKHFRKFRININLLLMLD